MTLRTKTVEYVWTTGTANVTTVTALAGTNFYTPTAITVFLSETDSTRVIRSAELIITARDAETTTATAVDGARIGVQVDAVAWSDVDLTGTGITNTADPYTIHFTRDVTSYMVTNFTGGSHSVGARVEFETAAGSLVNSITLKLRVTYEYQDTSATFTKTVRIPLEGNTGFLSTSANANFQGSTGAAQIPALDTFLPESNKSIKQHWIEITATDGGTNTTDFTMSCSIDGATTRTAGTVEQGLQGSTAYHDIWLIAAGYFTTNATHNLQLWSSTGSRFERCSATLVVTYTYDKPTSGTVLNSILLPFQASIERLDGTATGDKIRAVLEFWIEEPATVTLAQSAVFLTFHCQSGATIDIRVNAQGSTSAAYTVTSILHAGHHSLQHRIDVAHGGSAVTLARGKNTLTIDLFASVTTNVPNSFSGLLILNYTSALDAAGEGAHKHSTYWKIWTTHEGAIAGDTYREVATTDQRTPNIPETSYWIDCVACEVRANYTASSTASALSLKAEIQSGELGDDGWVQHLMAPATDSEFGYSLHWLAPLLPALAWDRWAGDHLALMDPETARKWRWNASHVMQWSMSLLLTYHAITFDITGTISGSGGGTVSVNAYRSVSGDKVGSTSRSGNGSYTITVYDDTEDYFAEARESASLLGRSDDDQPA